MIKSVWRRLPLASCFKIPSSYYVLGWQKGGKGPIEFRGLSSRGINSTPEGGVLVT